jgi:DNA replication protein DnaC
VSSAPNNPTTTPSPKSGRGGPAEPLAKSLATLYAKAGRFSPWRQKQLEQLRARIEARDRRLLAATLREASGVEGRYASADLADVEFVRRRMPAALDDYQAVRDELARMLEFPAMLVLRGRNGPGKTHLACALANAFCDRGLPARYATAQQFFLELKSTFGEPGRTQLDLIERYGKYELLVLDEIEVRSDKPWENQVLRGLIDTRYRRELATVLITNLGGAELQDYFSPAIRDRIREEGAILPCEWGSLRGTEVRS